MSPLARSLPSSLQKTCCVTPPGAVGAQYTKAGGRKHTPKRRKDSVKGQQNQPAIDDDADDCFFPEISKKSEEWRDSS